MGKKQGALFSPEFSRSIHVEARPERLSAEAGTLLLRELMERLGISALLAKHPRDPRESSRVTHPFPELLRTALLLFAQGFGPRERDGVAP